MYYQTSLLLSLLPFTLAKFNPTAGSSIANNGGNMNGPNAPRSAPFNPTAGSSIGHNGGNMNGPNAPRSVVIRSNPQGPSAGKKPILPRSVKRDLEEAYLDLLQAREAKAKHGIFADELIARYAYAEADEDDLFAREADDYFDLLDAREAHFNDLLQARDPDISSTTSGQYGGRGPEFSKGPRDLEARNLAGFEPTSSPRSGGSGPINGPPQTSGQIGGPSGGLSGDAGSGYHKFNGVRNGPPPGTTKPTIPLTGTNII